MKYGLLGYPLGHSISPYIHRRFFELCGVTDCEYNLYEVNPEELALKGSVLKELSGFNVTIPYKLEIIPYLARLDESAKRYGSVNCVHFDPVKSEFVGYNTDGYGFLKSLQELGASLEGAKVLLLGCGGTGRMMAIEAAHAGADLTIAINHTQESERAAANLSREITAITGKPLSNPAPIGQTGQIQPTRMRITYTDRLTIVNRYDIVLNATPCGMFPNVDEIPIVPEIFGKVNYLFDAIYNPNPTKLMLEAEKRGVQVIGGLSMLIHQAAKSQMIWNGVQIDDNIIKTICFDSEHQLQKL